MEKNQNQKITFQPLTSGLGFHPFSDGLPYAPISPTGNTTQNRSNFKSNPKPQTPMGAGATLAGPPTFITRPQAPSAAATASTSATASTIAIPRVSVPVAKSIQPQIERKEDQKPKVELDATVSSFSFSYLFRRILAYFLDTAIHLGVAGGTFALVLWKQNIPFELLFNSGVAMIAALFFFAFSWAMMTAQEIAFGTTLGKKIFKLALRGSATAIFLRAFFFLPSLGFLGTGLLWGLFDSKKRCWHDLIVQLQPTDLAKK